MNVCRFEFNIDIPLCCVLSHRHPSPAILWKHDLVIFCKKIIYAKFFDFFCSELRFVSLKTNAFETAKTLYAHKVKRLEDNQRLNFFIPCFCFAKLIEILIMFSLIFWGFCLRHSHTHVHTGNIQRWPEKQNTVIFMKSPQTNT